eukprot:3667408-Rhodomonas_salina.3
MLLGASEASVSTHPPPAQVAPDPTRQCAPQNQMQATTISAQNVPGKGLSVLDFAVYARCVYIVAQY